LVESSSAAYAGRGRGWERKLGFLRENHDKNALQKKRSLRVLYVISLSFKYVENKGDLIIRINFDEPHRPGERGGKIPKSLG